MIRTATVTLTVIPAVAYRQKLPSGGAGVTVLRYGAEQPGIAAISKTSGEPIPTDNTPAGLYPAEAFQEAMERTAGMPYGRRGGVRLTGETPIEAPPEPEPEELREEEAVIDSDEYQRVVDLYTDKRGKLSYELLNRDFIQTAHQSGQVRLMIEDKAPADDIRFQVVKAQLRKITRNPTLTDGQIQKMTELLDEVSPKGVFRPLNDELRRWLRTGKA